MKEDVWKNVTRKRPDAAPDAKLATIERNFLKYSLIARAKRAFDMDKVIREFMRKAGRADFLQAVPLWCSMRQDLEDVAARSDFVDRAAHERDEVKDIRQRALAAKLNEREAYFLRHEHWAA